jgi:hypothetical protein
MRLLIYLLALMSGFSAAEAARADVPHASTVAQTAVAAAETLALQEHVAFPRPALSVPQAKNDAELFLPLPQPATQTPVLRHDLSRQ